MLASVDACLFSSSIMFRGVSQITFRRASKKERSARANMMKRILFVCGGNISCSVMAQYMLRTMVDSLGLGDQFEIDSAGTSKVYEGEEICEGARQKLEEMNVPSGSHRARLMTWNDYDQFDYLIGMNETDIDDMRYIVGSDPDQKIHKLSEFSSGAGLTQADGGSKDIDDPWYTDDFDTAYREIQEGLMGLLNRLS